MIVRLMVIGAAVLGILAPVQQNVEQTSQGTKPAATLVESVDGMTPGAQGKPVVAAAAAETPPQIASSKSSAPMINYPRITGGTPGRPFLFRIPASGEGTLTFTAKNLPAGLTLDEKTGIISGSLKQEGRTDVQVSVKNAGGKMANTVITIVGGKDALALTPPLGWNSWNVWGGNVTADHVRAAADGMP